MTEQKDIPREYNGFTYDPDKHMYFESKDADNPGIPIQVGSIIQSQVGDIIGYSEIVHVEQMGDSKRVFALPVSVERGKELQQMETGKVVHATVEISKDGVNFVPIEEVIGDAKESIVKEGMLEAVMDKYGLPRVQKEDQIPIEYLEVKGLRCIMGHSDTGGFPLGYIGVPKENKHHGKSNERSIDGVVFEFAGKRNDIRMIRGAEDDGHWYFGFDYGNNTDVSKQDLMDDFEMYAGILKGEAGAGEAQIAGGSV